MWNAWWEIQTIPDRVSLRESFYAVRRTSGETCHKCQFRRALVRKKRFVACITVRSSATVSDGRPGVKVIARAERDVGGSKGPRRGKEKTKYVEATNRYDTREIAAAATRARFQQEQGIPMLRRGRLDGIRRGPMQVCAGTFYRAADFLTSDS